MSRNDQDESTSIGRPRAEISLDDVEFLLSLKLNITKIAALLKVSRSTIYRRMREEHRVMPVRTYCHGQSWTVTKC